MLRCFPPIFPPLAVFLGLLASGPVRAADPRFSPERFEPFCERVFFEKGFNPRLSAMERRLACGDPRPDSIGRPWSEIPPTQARYLLKTFLQGRGHHEPEFSIEGDRLYVRPGRRSEAAELEIAGVPPHWRVPRKRAYRGLPLTPALLDEMEGWTRNEVQSAGYACASVGAAADPGTGLIRVEIAPGERLRILDVVDLSETRLSPGVLDRYSAYRIGDFYSERLVQLTRRRLLEDGLLQAVAFSTGCFPNGVIVRRDPLMGPPRELRVGVGGNTDDGLRVRARAKQIRLGSAASSAEAKLDASFRRQEAGLLGRWHYSSSSPRDYLEPSLTFERLDDLSIESRAWQISVQHGWNRELETGRAEARIGPSWQISEIARGPGPGESTITFLESSLRWLSHDAEYFARSPRDGSRFEFDLLQTQKDWGAPFTARRGQIRGQVLWNLLRFDPPLIVLGVRYSLGTTWTDREIDAAALPVRFRFFAGGTDDLRGFERRVLPRGGSGGLTEALLGAEARFHKILFRRLDPLAFVDAGRLGSRSVRLDGTVYWSPGVGLRWESPVGTFRGFAARGIVSDPPPGLPGPFEKWRFGLSYGEEF